MGYELNDPIRDAYRDMYRQQRAMLRKVQWCTFEERCPLCHAAKSDGHRDECELDATLSINIDTAYESATMRSRKRGRLYK